VEPLVTATVEECRAKLPRSTELQWSDMRQRLHNCVSFICDLLQKLTASPHLPAAAVVMALFNDTIRLLFEVACQSATDVSTAVAFDTGLPNRRVIPESKFRIFVGKLGPQISRLKCYKLVAGNVGILIL